MTRLGLKARIDIPVPGTMINVVNDRLQVENPPNGWPITVESRGVCGVVVLPMAFRPEADS